MAQPARMPATTELPHSYPSDTRAATNPASVTVAPTERSMLPMRTTKVMPTATTRRTDASRSTVLAVLADRKLSPSTLNSNIRMTSPETGKIVARRSHRGRPRLGGVACDESVAESVVDVDIPVPFTIVLMAGRLHQLALPVALVFGGEGLGVALRLLVICRRHPAGGLLREGPHLFDVERLDLVLWIPVVRVGIAAHQLPVEEVLVAVEGGQVLVDVVLRHEDAAREQLALQGTELDTEGRIDCADRTEPGRPERQGAVGTVDCAGFDEVHRALVSVDACDRDALDALFIEGVHRTDGHVVVLSE